MEEDGINGASVTHWNMRNAYKISVGKLNGRDRFGGTVLGDR
jgi:hypothetical protein